MLNIALLLFAWRRSAQLKRAFAQKRAAEMKIRPPRVLRRGHRHLCSHRYLHVVARATCLAGGEKDMALLLLDLDQFKAVTHLCGRRGRGMLCSWPPPACNPCLLRAGRLLRAAGGATSSPCCCAAHAREEAAACAGRAARGRSGRPAELSETVVAVGVSIGIARVQGVSHELRWLLRRADIAMYGAKSTGKNRCLEFDESMEVELPASERRSKAEIRHGIAGGEFVPYFQPIVETRHGPGEGLRGAGALAASGPGRARTIDVPRSRRKQRPDRRDFHVGHAAGAAGGPRLGAAPDDRWSTFRRSSSRTRCSRNACFACLPSPISPQGGSNSRFRRAASSPITSSP